MELQERQRWWDDRGSGELREILLKDWDPLLVGDAPQAQDEYDGYLGELGSLLREGAGTGATAEYLSDVEGRMGFSTPADQLTGVAGRIVAWYEASTDSAA